MTRSRPVGTQSVDEGSDAPRTVRRPSDGRPPEGRRRRLEPDERRGQILACAVHLFGQAPYAEVSITQVAAAAGVARGLVNHYFGTKRGLYAEVVRALSTMPPFDEESLPHDDVGARIEAGVTWFLDMVARHARPWLTIVPPAAADRSPEVTAVLVEADDVTADTLLRLVGIDPAGPAQHARARAVLRAYSGFGKAAATEWLGNRTLERDEVHLMLTTTLTCLAHSVLPPLSRVHPSVDVPDA